MQLDTVKHNLEFRSDETYARIPVPVKTLKVFDHASYCNVLMTNEMHNSYNQFLFHIIFRLLYMFRKDLVVHHQQHGIIYRITQFGTIVQASLADSKQLDSPARLYRLYYVIQYIMPCS